MYYFMPSEFYCKCKRKNCSGKTRLIHPDLSDKLERLRALYAAPIIISSGLRCAEHNAEVGGAPDSSHVLGLAADIRCTNSVTRYELINLSMTHSLFSRIGISDMFLHLDCDPQKAGDVIWLYG
jgi:uncharacterized protein YcbK (DUF882 family)